MNDPALTRDERHVLARLARRPLQSLKRSPRVQLPGAPTDGPINGVSLNDLERRGYVERWPFGDCWLWRPTDQPPRFDRPHWQCRPMTEEERAEFGGSSALEGYVITVHVEPGQRLLYKTRVDIGDRSLLEAQHRLAWFKRRRVVLAIAAALAVGGA